MPEPRNPAPAWLESELAAHLGPAAAPAGLWQRVERAAAPAEQPAFCLRPWALAAALAAVAALSALWYVAAARDDAAQLNHLAVREFRNLSGHPERLDIQTRDMREAAAWLKAEGGLDVRCPNAAAVQVVGARLMRERRRPIGALLYRVAGRAAALFITPARPRDGEGPPLVETASAAGVRTYSWQMRGQAYTLVSAASADPRQPCVLCHVSLN